MESSAPIVELSKKNAQVFSPGDFEPENHFYSRVLNAHIHPLVAHFLRLTPDQIVNRFCHLNPRVDAKALRELLLTSTKYLRWSGVDLLCTTTAAGNRRLVILETNSSPSGNKSMPPLNDGDEQSGYRRVLEESFVPYMPKSKKGGKLGVLFDKNFTEASGYAATLAALMNEEVYLASFTELSGESAVRIRQGVVQVRSEGDWIPLRAAFRYVTQKPWNRIPIKTKTKILNPIIGCLAGGRNKLVANKAYELFNGEISETGLQLCVPETIVDVSKAEVPMWVDRFGGQAVVKDPYSNAGQGVFPLLRPEHLEAFMAKDYVYDKFVVQSLVGNYTWTSTERTGRYYQLGTIPNKKGQIFAFDLRMMVCSGPNGFKPVAIYARRAALPLSKNVSVNSDPWGMLGTNLSTKMSDGSWAGATDRLLLMDRKDFNRAGIGMDDLVEGYVQTVLASIAIDRMAVRLINKKGELRSKLFSSLDNDETLLAEVRKTKLAQEASNE